MIRGNALLTYRQRFTSAAEKETKLLDKLIVENRKATPSEQKALDECERQKKEAEKGIRELEELNEALHGGGDSSPGVFFRDTISGQEYRAIRHGERLSDAHRDEERLSVGRVLRGALLGDWRGAEEEQRAFSGLTGAGGAFLLPASLSSMVIDAARNKVRVVEAGALTIEVPDREVCICKVLQDADASYKQENAEATDTDMTFTPIVLHSRTLVAYATLSMEILQDAVNLDQVVTNALGESLALQMDRAALFGTGVGGEPLGLYTTVGINEVLPNANGFQIADYDEFSSAIQKIEDANGQAIAAIYSPRTAAALRELKEASTNAYLRAPEFFTELKRFTTNQVPNNLVVGSASTCSAAFVGDFSQFLFAMRQGLRVDTTEVGAGAWEKYQYKIRCTARFDCVALRPNHFTIIKGMKP